LLLSRRGVITTAIVGNARPWHAAIALMSVLALVSTVDPNRAGAARKVRLLVKPFVAETLDGGRVTEADLRSGVTVVTLWASWCAPCRKWLQRLDTISQQQGRTFRIVSINSYQTRAAGSAYAAERKFAFPVAFDVAGSTARAFPGETVPRIYLVRDGIILAEASSGGSAEDLISQAVAATR
jgi:thiol-disulfide isomerase/thioredoxin